MKNADMPAMPVPKGGDGRYPTEVDLDGFVQQCKPAFGFNKLEELSARMLASGDCPVNAYEHEARAVWAIDEAEALLAKLEKRHEP